MENRDLELPPKPGGLNNSKKTNTKSLSLRKKLRDDMSLVRKPNDPDNESKTIENFSIADSSASTSGLRESIGVPLREMDDSLADFRSPVKDNETNESIADFEVKPTVSKPQKRLTRKGSKPVVSKKRCNREVPSNVNQPSIESSFFKPQTEVKTAFLCPLCFKSFKDVTSQRNHMKSCAARNKISTNKLLDAVQLQEKQAEERKAMGLLAAPAIQPKKTISRKLISEKDPQLQLALALSMSLHEAQITEEIEDAHLLAGEPCFPMNSEMSEERRKTLQNFGFTTNKPAIASTSGKSRKKRPAGPTLLQIRTQEERDRILTVRIAEVLMGDEAITQALLENVEKVIESEAKLILRSRLLKSYHCVEDRLWEKTQQSLASRNSYSCNLVEISPCKVKPESETNKRSPEPRTSKLEPLQETSIPGSSKAIDVAPESSASAAIKLRIASEISVAEDKNGPTVNQNVNVNSLMDLSNDWRCMFCSTYMSDVTIIVRGDTKIHAHKIVFWARCYDILADVVSDDPERSWVKGERILWAETESFSAYAFLEFVYCGVIEQYVSVFDHPDMLTGIRILTRKYRLKKLFNYLRNKAAELKWKKREQDKAGNKSELKIDENSDDNSVLFSENESSISSVETDINSLSTACNDVTSNKQNFDERTSDSDNVSRKNFKSVNMNEKENISANLVVDCFSGSSDSFERRIPTTSTSTKIESEKLLDRRMSQRSFINVGTALTDITDIQNLTSRTTLLNNIKDNISKITNHSLEEERCISPDIFDDTVSISSTRTYIVSKKPENNIDTDTDIEVVCTSSNNLEIESPDSNGSGDKAVNMFENNLSRNSEKPEVDYTFVSTRRKQRSFRQVSNNSDNSSLDSRNLDPENTASDLSPRKKGDFTLLIEKARRLNAKTASESDSDDEFVEALPMRRRKNPFRINVTESSSMVEEIVKDDDQVPTKRRHKLSIFEKKMESEAAKNPAMFNLPTHKTFPDLYSEAKKSIASPEPQPSTSKLHEEENKRNSKDRIEPSHKRYAKLDDTEELANEVDEIFDLTQESSRESKLESDEDVCDTSTADQDLSMFTKYKRNHSHNSIAKYRHALMNISAKTSASSIKDTDEALSSDVSQSLDVGSPIISTKANRDSLLSRYEYTDPNQSTSNLHKELNQNVTSKAEEEVRILVETLSSSEENDKEQNTAKPDDDELSDLEIDLSDFSGIKSCTKSWNSKVNNKSQHASTSKRKSNDTCGGFDSFTDIKFDDTEFSIMKNDSGKKKTNISDQDTDTEYFVESKTNQMKKRFDLNEDKSCDIYSEETDTGEMEKKDQQPGPSGSKMNKPTQPQKVVSPESLDEDRCKIPSPDCEISGIFTPPSTSFDTVANISDNIDNLLEECKMSSRKFRSLHMNQDHCNSQATSSNSVVKTKNDVNLLNEFTDSEFDDIEFVVNQDTSKSDHPNNEFANESSTASKSAGVAIYKKREKNHRIVESDSSNSSDFKINKTNKSPRISLKKRSKSDKRQSKPSGSDIITPEKGSRSSLRCLKVKSVSENVIKTKSKGEVNFMNDSFDMEFAKLQTPPGAQRSIDSNNQKTPQQGASSANVTPLANYSAMKSPELRKELQKYGLKAQKRHRAKQLLRYIYNELHPLVQVADKNVASYSSESSSDDERPAAKRLNRSKIFVEMNSRKNAESVESDCETLASDSRTGSDVSNDIEGLGSLNFGSSSQSNSSKSLEIVFRRLIEMDKSLHNKILAYEPLKLEELHSTLKAQGLKCKLNALMDFLDEQCITFRTMGNSKKSRTRKKGSPKKNQAN